MFLFKLFLLFIAYSFIGWLVEVIYVYIDKKVLVNRGFLYGPYCPIYGAGSLVISIFLSKYYNHPLIVLFLSMIICLIIEYLTSYLLEVVFDEKWWDYTDRKYNISGRVCLETLFPFGIFGLIGLYIMDPFFLFIFSLLNNNILIIISSLIFIMYLVDSITSIYFKIKIKSIKYDYKYNKYVKKIISYYLRKDNSKKYIRINNNML